MTRFPYRPGDEKALCDRCGRQYYLSQLIEEYTGLMVDEGCLDEQHPQELAPPPRVERPLVNARPSPPDNFIEEMSVSRDDL